MRVLVVTVQAPFVRGGAEIHAEGLVAALRAAGHEAELTAIPFKWYPADAIPPQMLACRLLDMTESDGVKTDRLIGLKFPAYLIPHPNKVLWVLHQHRPAYDLWEHALGDLAPHPRGAEIRDAIMQADLQAFGEARRLFANSGNVAKRMRTYCGVESAPLYHPPANAERYYTRDARDYLFFPSRLSPNKRQHLVVEALTRTRQPVKVWFASSSDHPTYARELHETVRRLGVEDRVRFLGSITEDEKLRLFAEARAVLYPPVDEDYGYVTLEGMLAAKPVLTCWDSGGPMEFIKDRENGLVAEPTAESLAYVMDRLWADPAAAARMGATGRKVYDSHGITWPRVVEKLLS